MSRKGALTPRPPLLSRPRRYAVYSVGMGLWLTGAVWVLAHYFLIRNGPFGPSPHPLEFWSRASHGAFGLASLFLFGLLWSAHIPHGWRSHRRPCTGSLMFGLLVFFAISGYLLYYLGNDEVISAVAALHWAAGLASPLPFLWHRFAGPGGTKNAPAMQDGLRDAPRHTI